MRSGFATPHVKRVINIFGALCVLAMTGCDQSDSDLATPTYSATVSKNGIWYPTYYGRLMGITRLW